MLMKTQDIWENYADAIKYFILSKVKDKTVADDLLQETFIKVHVKLETLDSQDKLKAWIFSIARNIITDYFRRKSKIYEKQNDFVISHEHIADHSKLDCLYGIIKNLPKKYRDPIFLSDIRGMKQTKVSEYLNLPLPTIKSQIQRGRKLIKQGFIDCCDFQLNEKGYLVGELKEKAECKVCSSN